MLKKTVLPSIATILILATLATPSLQASPVQREIPEWLDTQLLGGLAGAVVAGEIPSTTDFAMPASVVFGTDIMVSVEHFRRTIAQNEPTIAVSPLSPSNLMAGYHDRFPTIGFFVCGISVSGDSGASWTFVGRTPLVLGGDFCSDPALAAGPDGNFYYAYLSVRSSVLTSDIVVAKIAPDGTVLDKEIAVKGIPRVTFPDKEYIVVDTTGGPFSGNIYISYTEFSSTFPRGAIRVVKSTIALDPFTAPITIEPGVAPGHVQTSYPAVGPSGQVYVAYMKIDDTGVGPTDIRVVRSDDGGAAFTPPISIGEDRPTPGQFRLRNAEALFGVLPGLGFRSNSGPVPAAAPDGSAVYATWAEFPLLTNCSPDGGVRPPCEDANVVLSSSTDGPTGLSWTPPIVVHSDGTTTDQFFPWMTVKPTGSIHIIYGDKRNDPANINYEVFHSESTDGGVSFDPTDEMVSSAVSITGVDRFIGDYFNAASTATTVTAIWTDRRFQNDDIFANTGF